MARNATRWYLFSTKSLSLYFVSVQKMSRTASCVGVTRFYPVPKAHLLVIAAPRPSVCQTWIDPGRTHRGALFCLYSDAGFEETKALRESFLPGLDPKGTPWPQLPFAETERGERDNEFRPLGIPKFRTCIKPSLTLGPKLPDRSRGEFAIAAGCVPRLPAMEEPSSRG
jgi:hypothetical protein